MIFSDITGTQIFKMKSKSHFKQIVTAKQHFILSDS